MGTKKEKIAELREGIKVLKLKNQGQKDHIAVLEKRIGNIEASCKYDVEWALLNGRHHANELQQIFIKDLTWLKLSPDSLSKFHQLKQIIEQLKYDCKKRIGK